MLVDTNIILDWLIDRVPFSESAFALWHRIESGNLKASVTATTLTDIYYIARNHIGSEKTREKIMDLVRKFEILPVDRIVIERALASPIRDFEDAIQDAAAKIAGISIIVTRDAQGFTGSFRRILDAQSVLDEIDKP